MSSSVSFDKHIKTYCHNHSQDLEKFHHPAQHSYALFIVNPLPAAVYICFLIYSVSFIRMSQKWGHGVRSLLSLAFSLSIKYLRLNCIITSVSTSFLSIAENDCIVWMLFILHLKNIRFEFFVIISRDTVNIQIVVFVSLV